MGADTGSALRANRHAAVHLGIRGATHGCTHVTACISVMPSLQTDSWLSPGDASTHSSDLVHIVYAIWCFGVLDVCMSDVACCWDVSWLFIKYLWFNVQVQMTAKRGRGESLSAKRAFSVLGRLCTTLAGPIWPCVCRRRRSRGSRWSLRRHCVGHGECWCCC